MRTSGQRRDNNILIDLGNALGDESFLKYSKYFHDGQFVFTSVICHNQPNTFAVTMTPCHRPYMYQQHVQVEDCTHMYTY